MLNHTDMILFDAGVFIGALLAGDARHVEARSVVEAARYGEIITYDADDWLVFEPDGLRIAGPVSTLAKLQRTERLP